LAVACDPRAKFYLNGAHDHLKEFLCHYDPCDLNDAAWLVTKGSWLRRSPTGRATRETSATTATPGRRRLRRMPRCLPPRRPTAMSRLGRAPDCTSAASMPGSSSSSNATEQHRPTRAAQAVAWAAVLVVWYNYDIVR
jgi:hypothetical protein